MIVLDLFCGAGGASAGYHAAGFDVIGVDIAPQPHYPYQFIQADAIQFLEALILSGNVDRFALIHASPPCQAYSVTKAMHNNDHPELIDPIRKLLQRSNKPYVIENVPGSPLNNPITLCGTMFKNLRVIRHRLFETHPPIYFPPAVCNHWGKATSSSATRRANGKTMSLSMGYSFVTVCGNDYLADEGRMAMGIDWMPKSKLSQAIPPAYTEWIGNQLKRMIT